MRRLLVAVALVALVACGGGKDSGDTTTTSPVEDTGGLPYYLPNFLPFGYAIVDGVVLHEGPATRAFTMAVGKPAGPSKYTDVVILIVRAVNQASTATTAAVPGSRAVDINGTKARLIESADAGTSVDWFTPTRTVGVSGPVKSTDVVTDVAKRIRLSDDIESTTLDGVPAGYEVIAQERFNDREPEEMQLLTVRSKTAAVLYISVTRTKLPLVFATSGGNTVVPERVRGHDAVASERFRDQAGKQVVQTTLAWHERDDLVITITGTFRLDELTPIAEGMGHVTESEWVTAVDANKQP